MSALEKKHVVLTKIFVIGLVPLGQPFAAYFRILYCAAAVSILTKF